MHLLLILALSVMAMVSLACPPPVAPPPATNSTTGRKKRSVEPVIVTLVTNAPYDKATNQNSLAQVKTLLRNFIKAQNLQFDRTQISESVKNSGGKFAIEYSGELDCNQVKNFVLGVKTQSQELAYVLLNCGSQLLQIL